MGGAVDIPGKGPASRGLRMWGPPIVPRKVATLTSLVRHYSLARCRFPGPHTVGTGLPTTLLGDEFIATLEATHRARRPSKWAHEAPPGDPYEAADRKRNASSKAAANAAFAAAVRHRMDNPALSPTCVVLDDAAGGSSRALISAGVPPSSIAVPNPFPHAVASLRALGVRAWCGVVEDVIEGARGRPPDGSRALALANGPAPPPMCGVYLDFIGSVVTHAPACADVVRYGVVGAGSIFCITASTRGPAAAGWSRARALFDLVSALALAAADRGLVLEGDAASGWPADGKGLALIDYSFRSPAADAGEGGMRLATAGDPAQAGGAPQAEPALAALARCVSCGDVRGVAASLAAWADAPGDMHGAPRLRESAARLACLSMAALGPHAVLGVAWLPKGRGSPPTHVPLATLGGDGAALEDELARKLWATAHSVLAWHNVRPPASAVDGSPPDSEAAAPPGHTRLRRALHLYDGQMAHLIVTLRSASSSSSMIPPITPPLGSSPGKRGPLIKDVNVNVR